MRPGSAEFIEARGKDPQRQAGYMTASVPDRVSAPLRLDSTAGPYMTAYEIRRQQLRVAKKSEGEAAVKVKQCSQRPLGGRENPGIDRAAGATGDSNDMTGCV